MMLKKRGLFLLAAASAFLLNLNVNSLGGRGEAVRLTVLEVHLSSPTEAFIRRLTRAVSSTARRVTSTVRRVSSTVTRTTNQVRAAVSSTVRTVTTAATTVVNKTTNAVNTATKAVTGAVTTATSAVAGAAKTVGSAVAGAARTVGTFFKNTGKTIGAWTVKAAKKTAAVAKQIGAKAVKLGKLGLNYLVKQFKEIWKAMKTMECGNVVEAFKGFDVIGWGLGKIHPKIQTCWVEICKGFFCAIPDMFTMVGKMIYSIAKTAWKKRSTCLRPPATGMSSLICGFVHWAKERVTRMYSCLKAMKGNKILGMLLDEMFKLACGIAGGLIFDALVAVLSGGSSLVATIAKWLGKLKNMVSPSSWLKIQKTLAQHAVNNVAAYTVNSLKRVHACQPAKGW